MKVANSCSAEDVRVKLCFFVKVRNANGLKVAGGRRIGRIVALVGGAMANGLSVCAGVPKAGDEDGMGFEGAGVFGANIDAAVRLFPCILNIAKLYQLSFLLPC